MPKIKKVVKKAVKPKKVKKIETPVEAPVEAPKAPETPKGYVFDPQAPQQDTP